MRFKVRRANIRQDLRDLFTLYGTEVVALALGVGTLPVGGGGFGGTWSPTVALQTVHLNQQAAAEWLRERRDKTNAVRA
jgi:hypothetical protein